MDLASLNISLTRAQRNFVDEQVAKGGYRTAAEYMRQLIRADQQRQASQDELEIALLEAISRLERGDGADVNQAWVEEKKAALLRRFGSRDGAA